MGRPVNDRFLGDYTDAGFQISAVVHVDAGEGPEPGYILRQRSNSKYLVEGVNSSVQLVCKLVAKLEPALGEMSVSVFSDKKGLVTAKSGQDETDYDGAGDNGSFVGGLGHANGDILTLSNGASITVDAISSGLQVINAQDETAFDNAGGNGTFAAGTGYSVADVITLSNNTEITVDAVSGDTLITLNQSETEFDNAGGNGTFAGGSGYSIADVITLDNATEITVDNVDGGGAVTEFTVSVVGNNAPAGVALSQAGVVPAGGTGFTLTPEAPNLDDVGDITEFTVSAIGTPTTAGTTLTQSSVAPAGGSGFTLTVEAPNLENVGDITQFTVTDGGDPVAAGATLTQSATDGSGTGFTLTIDSNNDDPVPEFARIINNRTVKTFLGNIYSWPENSDITGRTSIDIQGQ